MRILLMLAMLLGVTACKTTVDADNATYKGSGYQVEIGDDDDHDGNFCPPGQAKKGRC